MIYVKSSTQLATKLTHAIDVQVCEVTTQLAIREQEGFKHVASGGGLILDYKWDTLTTQYYSNIIHDTTQEVYNYDPILQVAVYRVDNSMMYRYCMIIPYGWNLSNIDGTNFKFKLVIQAI